METMASNTEEMTQALSMISIPPEISDDALLGTHCKDLVLLTS